MEMFIIAVIVLVAFAAVLLPLVRRRPGAADAREFEGDASAATTGSTPVARVALAAAPSPAFDSATAAPADHAASTDLAATGAIETSHDDAPVVADDVELEVQRYRAAVRAGTVCRKCGQANPADSMFCFECGERLPRDEAREFE